MKKISAVLALLMAVPLSYATSRITQEHKDRAAEIVGQMTLKEKCEYIGGYQNWYIRAIDRLGLPAVRMADGPQGVRNNTQSTLYPSGIAAAATWDRSLIGKMGVALGQDARARGVHILLGPGVNIYRSPLCGRNFEYFGEDPYLAGEIAASYIIGLQSQGVMASIKHFAGNNQEYARHSVSSDIDERTLHEIYFPAFEKAVKKADVATIMTSYNLLNSVHASESKYLNYDVLRDMWGYEGIVMSDWVSCYSPLNVATWGVDIEMPSPKCMRPEVLMEKVRDGSLDVRYIDRKCQHIIQTILAFEFDKRPQLDRNIPENNPYSDSVALEVSRASMVLLKNLDGFLPVSSGRIFVCGPNADKIVTGGGSGFVTPILATSVAEGMKMMDRKIRTTVYTPEIFQSFDTMYADEKLKTKGVKSEIYESTNLKGTPIDTYVSDKVLISNKMVEVHEDLETTKLSSRHTFWFRPETDAEYTVILKANDGGRLFMNDRKVIDIWKGSGWQKGVLSYKFKSGEVYKFVVEHVNYGGPLELSLEFKIEMSNSPKYVEALRQADCAVVCLGFDSMTEKENYDRTFTLPGEHLAYLREVLKYNRNVVAVVNGGGGFEMNSWISDVKAVLMAWYPGQQGGVAVSEIVTGKISPCGKLPVSIEKDLKDNPTSENYYENVPRMRSKTINPYSRVEYKEGIFMGYRGYDKTGIKPMFPFGFGLSYATFDYSDIRIEGSGKDYIVKFDVTNTGKMTASEIAQVYVTDRECTLVRPEKELKGFEKVTLKPGEIVTLSVPLSEEAFRYFDPFLHEWVVEPGEFTVSVGASSADIRLRQNIRLEK